MKKAEKRLLQFTLPDHRRFCIKHDFFKAILVTSRVCWTLVQQHNFPCFSQDVVQLANRVQHFWWLKKWAALIRIHNNASPLWDKWFTSEDKWILSFIMYDIHQQQGNFVLNGKWFHIKSLMKFRLRWKWGLA